MKTNLTPEGIQDFNPSETKAQIKVVKNIAKVFDTQGFQRIKTPTIEYFDSLKKGLGPNLMQKAIKFFDPSGNTLVLRPDHTTPIARLVATRMANDALPLKLSYVSPVFRKSESALDGGIEQLQAGIEYIGGKTAIADAETLITLIKSLQTIKGLDFGIDIGHVDFTKGLSDEKRQALLDGDYLTFGKIPERGDDSLLPKDNELVALYKRLRKEKLDHYVTINKGLVKDIQYYTGIIFEAYDKKQKCTIASGGRYDNLLSKFGYPQPAVGFAIGVDSISEKKS